MILSMPLPNRFTLMMIAMAIIARIQFADALLMPTGARIKPMRMMIGPVTTGGKSLMIFLGPKTPKRIASTT